MPLDQHPLSTYPETTAGDDIGAATLHAVFLADERPAYLGLYTGVGCVLPTGEVVEVHGRRTPLYDLARELEKRGYGDWKLQAYTPTGTPSLRGLVKVMAALTVEEGPCGLRRRKYRPARGGESAVDSQVELEGTRGGQKRLTALLDRTAPPARRRDFYAASLLLKS